MAQPILFVSKPWRNLRYLFASNFTQPRRSPDARKYPLFDSHKSISFSSFRSAVQPYSRLKSPNVSSLNLGSLCYTRNAFPSTPTNKHVSAIFPPFVDLIYLRCASSQAFMLSEFEFCCGHKILLLFQFFLRIFRDEGLLNHLSVFRIHASISIAVRSTLTTPW